MAVTPSWLNHRVSAALITALGCALLPAQETTIRSNVKVVNVYATVREKDGRIVTNLTKDDFILAEDGRPQNIRYFAQESDLPLTLGLLVDTSISQQNVLPEEKAASYAFLNSIMREQRDQAFVIHFDFEVELLQDITSSRRHLEAALDELSMPDRGVWRRRNFQASSDPSPFQRFPRGGRGGQRRGAAGVGTLLYDAVYLASHDVMQPVAGRKALIILSDGEDYGSKLGLEDGVEAALRADTVVYSILYADDDGLLGRLTRGNGKRVLEQLSRQTGGRMFEVSRKLSIRQIYAQIEEELRNQYSLGYSSDRPAESGGFRKIRVHTRNRNLVVQARDGYYPDRQLR